MIRQAQKVDRTLKTATVSYKGYSDGTIDFLGNQIELMTGYSQKDFSSRVVKWTDLFYEEDLESTREVFKHALKGDKTYTREYRVRAKSGDLRWMQEWSHIICDDKGDVEYITGILIDITENKKTEAARLKCERRTGKYLTFALAGQEYGISILKVKEIIEIMQPTPVPQVPYYVRGIINLRGRVIPVVDLKAKLGLDTGAFSDRSCIIVVEIEGQHGVLLTGVMVDTVSDVVYLQGTEIEDTPTFLEAFDADYIMGMAKIDKSLKVILDIGKVLEGMDMGADRFAA